MTKRKLFVIALTLCCCLALARPASALSGCSNTTLSGYYNAQVSNMNLQNALQAVNSAKSPALTAATGPTAPTVTGFGGNPKSLSGSLPGVSRFFLDGNGLIIGLDTGVQIAVGAYNVNLDCTATLTLQSGATFEAVVTRAGKEVDFIQTDATGAGAVGSLLRTGSCIGLQFYPQNYGFSVAGATQAPDTMNADGTTTPGPFMPASLVGTIATDGMGNFTISETSVVNGALAHSKGGGIYEVGTDCSLKLTFFNVPSTTVNFVAPLAFTGLTVDDTGGVLSVQANQTTSFNGTFTVQ